MNRPIEPARPVGMELVFFYRCPACQRELPLVAPPRPTMITCDVCGQKFPIVPVDEHTVQYVKFILANGPAAVDPDFL